LKSRHKNQDTRQKFKIFVTREKLSCQEFSVIKFNIIKNVAKIDIHVERQKQKKNSSVKIA